MMRTSSGNTEQVRNVLHVQILSATFIRSQGSSSLLRPLTWRWWGRSRSHSTARSQDTSEDNYQVTKNQRNLAESSKTKSSDSTEERLWVGYSSVSSFCHQSHAATKLLILFRFIQQSFKNYKTDSLMRSNTWLWPGEYLVGHHYHGCYYDDTFLDDNRDLGSSEVKSGCWYSDGGWC